MAISINTVRQILDKVYGKYDLEDNYCNNVGRSNRKPGNSRKVYRFTAHYSNGTKSAGSNWLTAREIIDLLGPRV